MASCYPTSERGVAMQHRCALWWLIVLSFFTGSRPAAAEERTTLKEDLAALQGEWKTSEKARVGLEVTFFKMKEKDSVSLKASAPGSNLTALVPFALKEAGGKRFIESNQALAKVADMPARISYRFENGELILAVDEGKLKGEHRLQKAKK